MLSNATQGLGNGAIVLNKSNGNGYPMWNAEWQECLYAMFVGNSNMGISKIYIRFSGSTGGQTRNRIYWTTREFYHIFGKVYENGQSGCFARWVL